MLRVLFFITFSLAGTEILWDKNVLVTRPKGFPISTEHLYQKTSNMTFTKEVTKNGLFWTGDGLVVCCIQLI